MSREACVRCGHRRDAHSTGGWGCEEVAGWGGEGDAHVALCPCPRWEPLAPLGLRAVTRALGGKRSVPPPPYRPPWPDG